MSEKFTRRNLVLTGITAMLAGCSSSKASIPKGKTTTSTTPTATSTSTDQQTAPQASHPNGPLLNRFATTAEGAEITGLHVSSRGELFFNVQHPEPDNVNPFDTGTVGAVANLNINNLPQDFASVQLPQSEKQKEVIQLAAGKYQPLANGGAKLGNGSRFGVPSLPNGERLTDGRNPDFNGFVQSDESEDEGYLFTNWETMPGMVTRLHLQRKDGAWRVRDAINIDFKDVEGTVINCFGSVSPWGTPLSAEENYAHVATEYWNSPNPGEKHWGLGGVEDLARYLGAKPNKKGIFDEKYPNPYRYGYIVEITEPQSENPTPEKRVTIGRYAHENAVVMPDRKTVYASSDGTGKFFYKFVADKAGDLSAGTLYAAKAIQQAKIGASPQKAGFSIEWIELAHGSDEKIESWIAEYDDVTQADYTEGETSYITDEEIKAWANGNAEDDRVAFLETHKAAKTVGATGEFRKMEGVNIRPDAQPGDYLYMAMSEVNETMTDSKGDIQLQGNDYGAVYRFKLEDNYNVSQMEPLIVGGPEANVCGGCPYDAHPDSGSNVCKDCAYNPNRETEEGDSGRGMQKLGKSAWSLLQSDEDIDPDNAIANPDNLVVLEDGRVVIGEDTDFHHNQMIWVYTPEE